MKYLIRGQQFVEVGKKFNHIEMPYSFTWKRNIQHSEKLVNAYLIYPGESVSMI